MPSELTHGWRYQLLGRAGSGGTSEVWRARDYRSGDAVALKVASGDKAALLAHEAELLFPLDCPLVPSVRDLGIVPNGVDGLPPGAAYVALSWVEGHGLEVKGVRTGADREAVALAVARDIGEALWHLHEAGVAHGDVKPRNILVTSGANPRATLVDFGFSTALSGGAFLGGTPRYIGPEGVSGRASARSQDLWALGVVMAETLSDEVSAAFEPGSAIRAARLPEPFRSWCLALTAHDPGARPGAGWLVGRAREFAGVRTLPGEGWRVKAAYLRVRREDILNAAAARDVTWGKGTSPWANEAVDIGWRAAQLRGVERRGAAAFEPMGPADRARWLVCLVGPSAAAWQLRGALADAPRIRAG